MFDEDDHREEGYHRANQGYGDCHQRGSVRPVDELNGNGPTARQVFIRPGAQLARLTLFILCHVLVLTTLHANPTTLYRIRLNVL